MNDLEQWKQDLENYYRNLFFMDPKHKDDWQEAARRAAESQYQAELLKRQTSVNLPEVTVTASTPTKTVVTESDWDPGYTKFMSGLRYYANQDHKNYLDWQRNDYTRGIREATDKWGNAIGAGVEIASGFTPLWWVAPAVRTGLDLSEGDYKGAALNAGLAFAAPYAVGKVILYVTPYAKSAIIASKLNKKIKNTKLSNTRIVEKNPDYLYHQEWPRKADGIKRRGETVQVGKLLHSAVPREHDYIWWDKGMKTYPAAPIVRVKKQSPLDIHPLTLDAPGIKHTYLKKNYYVTPAQSTNIDDMITFRQWPDGSMAPYSTNRVLNNRMSIDEMFLQPISDNPTIISSKVPAKTSLAFFERQPAKISKSEKMGVRKGLDRTLVNNEEEILNNAKSFAEKYGYEIPETIDAAKAMYNLHNSFFRTPSNHESVILHYDPELAKLPLELQYFKLASKGYPESMRSYDFSQNGIYSDDFVFVAPDYGEVMPYINDVPAVMLRRPFRKSNPLTWHKDAEWTIQSKYTPYDQIFGKNKIGTAQIGNAGPLHEFKVSTRHLQPVKIAEPTDKGTLLGIYLGPYEYKSGGTINYLNFFK